MKKSKKTFTITKKLEIFIIISVVFILVVSLKIELNKKNINLKDCISDYSNINENVGNNLASKNSDNENTEKVASERKSNITSRSLNSRETNNMIEQENIEVEQKIEEIEPTIEEIIEEPEVITTKIEDVKISKDMDLTVRTGLSKEDFIILISGVKEDTSGFFEENAGLIYDVCEKYEINEIFFCGLISAESGWQIAGNHRRTHNYISLMSKNGLIKFASVEDGLEKAAKTLHDKYLTPGGVFFYGATLNGVKTKFCPASSTWTNLVYQRMAQIIK